MTRDLFFRRQRQDEVIGEIVPMIEMKEDGDQRDQATARIVASETIKLPVEFEGRIGVEGIGLVGFYGIVMRIEEDGREGGVEMFVFRPDIVLDAMDEDMFGGKPGREEVSRAFFFLAEGRDGDELFQQAQRVGM
jgi:hypothetical protein